MELSRVRRTRRPSVVWLDDQMPLLLEQVGHLNVRGFDVQPTDSVTGFLRALQGQSVNIAIIDIKLGGAEDGRALIDLVYQSRPEIGIIVHSSFPEDFLSSRSLYDPGRVRFVEKDEEAEPVAADDAWVLSDTLTELVDTLNGRQVGLNPLPVAIISNEHRRPVLTWATVQRLREFAMEHFMLAIIGALLLLKIALLRPQGGPTLETIGKYLLEVGGFAAPFIVALILARLLTPEKIRTAHTPDKFVHLHLEEIGVSKEMRALVNQEITRSGVQVPPDDFSALVAYYDVLIVRRLWLARLVIAIFAGGICYLVYDIARDLLHLWPAANGH